MRPDAGIRALGWQHELWGLVRLYRSQRVRKMDEWLKQVQRGSGIALIELCGSVEQVTLRGARSNLAKLGGDGLQRAPVGALCRAGAQRRPCVQQFGAYANGGVPLPFGLLGLTLLLEGDAELVMAHGAARIEFQCLTEGQNALFEMILLNLHLPAQD